MRSLLTIVVCIAMLLSMAACGTAPENSEPAAVVPDTEPVTDTEFEVEPEPEIVDPPETPFDENNIVLSFGAISDVHITGGALETNKFRMAFAQLKATAAKNDPDGLDAVCIAGDIANNGEIAQAELFAQLVKESGVKNVLLTVGNHDVYNGGTSITTLDVYRELLGEEHFAADTDMSMFDKGARHCVVGDYHFFFVEPQTFANPRPYDEEVIKWLDESLNAITTENPNAFVFLFTHLPIADTVWGSYPEDGDYTPALKATLSKYPQVVTFSGHMHRPIIDERTIMQTEFTSVLCGSLRNLVFEAGYSNMLEGDWEASLPKDGHLSSTGHLVQIDINGNMRITRMAFASSSTYKEPWEVSAPTASGRHLTKYTMERKDTNVAPTLTGELKVTVSSGNPLSATVQIPAGEDDDFVHTYLVKVTSPNGMVVSDEKYLSDFYRATSATDMSNNFGCTISVSYAGEYTVSVTAVDSWGAQSETVSTTVTFG